MLAVEVSHENITCMWTKTLLGLFIVASPVAGTLEVLSKDLLNKLSHVIFPTTRRAGPALQLRGSGKLKPFAQVTQLKTGGAQSGDLNPGSSACCCLNYFLIEPVGEGGSLFPGLWGHQTQDT